MTNFSNIWHEATNLGTPIIDGNPEGTEYRCYIKVVGEEPTEDKLGKASTVEGALREAIKLTNGG